jgi:hypothetical protein
MKTLKFFVLFTCFMATTILANARLYIEYEGAVLGSALCAFSVWDPDHPQPSGEATFVGIVLLPCDVCDNGMVSPGASGPVLTPERNPDVYRKLREQFGIDETGNIPVRIPDRSRTITEEELNTRYRTVIVR